MEGPSLLSFSWTAAGLKRSVLSYAGSTLKSFRHQRKHLDMHQETKRAYIGIMEKKMETTVEG